MQLQVFAGGETEPIVLQKATPPCGGPSLNPSTPLLWQSRQGQLLLDMQQSINQADCKPLAVLLRMDWRKERQLKGLGVAPGGPITSASVAKQLQGSEGHQVLPDYQYGLALLTYSPLNKDG